MISRALAAGGLRWPRELPTWCVWLAVHAGWLLLTWFWQALPAWALVVLAGPLVCWHSSYQHEAVHGHPTGHRRLDDLLAALPVGLWMPYGRYREIHRAHHKADLTCPIDDPESFYVTPAAWRHSGPAVRAVLRVRTTLAGRLTLGPILYAGTFWWGEARHLVRGDRRRLRHWAAHLAGVAVIVAWLVGVGVPIAEYVLFAAYPALSLTLLRSYAEHRAAPDPADRSVMVRTAWPLRLLYLNNTFHALHHREPGLAWYKLPGQARTGGAVGGYPLSGYFSVVRRHLFRAWDSPVHPISSRGVA